MTVKDMQFDDITLHCYDPDELRRHLRKDDFWLYPIDPQKVEETTNLISDNFIKSNFEVQNIKRQIVGNKSIYTMGSLYDALTIRRTNEILKKTIKYQTPSREEEIKQLWAILAAEKKRSWVFRSDVSSFFETLPYSIIIEDLFSNSQIGPSTYKHLSSILRRLSNDNYTGLPRGLPISSSLSEYAMLSFDKYIRSIQQCIYYSRYVDDILIITGDIIPELKIKINEALPFNLKLNDAKTQNELVGSKHTIDFLGFSFPLDNPTNACIALKKINKTKKRLILALRRFIYKDRDFDLLINRLQFLTGITLLHMAGREKEIAVGIKYHYSLCKADIILGQLKPLDTFYKSIIYSKRFYIANKLRSMLTTSQFDILYKISFTAGFINSITHSRNRKEISSIKDAWRYE